VAIILQVDVHQSSAFWRKGYGGRLLSLELRRLQFKCELPALSRP